MSEFLRITFDNCEEWVCRKHEDGYYYSEDYLEVSKNGEYSYELTPSEFLYADHNDFEERLESGLYRDVQVINEEEYKEEILSKKKMTLQQEIDSLTKMLQKRTNMMDGLG